MTDGLLSLSWNNHKATFCHILSTLREKERYTDVTLACEGKFYPTHKLVLSTCSEYFEKMFENTPCKHPVILLGKDVKCDELEALLSYMYDGVVSVAQNDLARLIKVAELLQIKGLAVPDEPPQTKKNYSWNSRDDRTSPHPKRRRREESQSSAHCGDKNTSPPSSPLRQEPEQIWENSNTTEGPGNEEISQRLEFTTKQESDIVQNQENSEDTLVKEEIVETIDDNPNEDPGMDYSSHTGSDSAAGGDEHTSKYSQLDPKQSQPLHEAVVEALAGPSGMQGWLGTGDMGAGFPMLESYSEDGTQDTQPAPLSGSQQPHQMVWLENDNRMADKVGSLSAKVYGNSRRLKEIFQCPQCFYTCTKRYNFIRHCRTHTGERPYACPYCPYQARDNSILTQHVLTHTREKAYTCQQCPFQTRHKNVLSHHMRVHSSDWFSCPHCPFQSREDNEFRLHVQSHK